MLKKNKVTISFSKEIYLSSLIAHKIKILCNKKRPELKLVQDYSAVPPELLPYEKQSLKTNFCLTHSHGAPTKESACVRIDRFRSDCGW